MKVMFVEQKATEEYIVMVDDVVGALGRLRKPLADGRYIWSYFGEYLLTSELLQEIVDKLEELNSDEDGADSWRI